MTDLDATFRKAKRIAQAASPGPWRVVHEEGAVRVEAECPQFNQWDWVAQFAASPGHPDNHGDPPATARVASWAPHVLPAMEALREEHGRALAMEAAEIVEHPEAYGSVVQHIKALDSLQRWYDCDACAVLAAWAESVEEASDE